MRHFQSAVLTAMLAIVGWYLSWLLFDMVRLEAGLVRTLSQGAFFGLWLGVMLTFEEYFLLDRDLLLQPVHWWQPALQGLLLGGLGGALSFYLADALYQAANDAPWARPLGWAAVGLMVGGLEGLKWQSLRRALTAAAGAGLGGVIGSLCIEGAPRVLAHPHDPLVATVAAAGTLGVFGALLGLGMSASQALSRKASLTVLMAPLPKQLDLSFDVGSIGDQETLGSLKATWTLTGDSQIQPKHAMLVRDGAAYMVHPLEGATLEVSQSPVPPEGLVEVDQRPFTTLAGPGDRHVLRDGDVLRLGQGTYLYFQYNQVMSEKERRAPAPILAGVVLALMALAWAPGAVAAPYTLQLQGSQGRQFPTVQTDVLVLDGEEPVEQLGVNDFRVLVDGRPVQAIRGLQVGAESADPNFIVLVMDKSGSMNTPSGPADASSKLVASKAAATRFIDQLREGDQVAVVSFDDAVTLTEFTASKEQLHAQVAAIEMAPGLAGRTNLYEGVGKALELIGRARETAPQARCAVVALTDGAHNVPGAFTREHLVELARRHRVTLYTIGFGDLKAPKGTYAYVDETFMRWLAGQGHGTYHHASSEDELRSAYDRILRAIKGQYRLVYTLAQAQPDPFSHPLRIQVRQPGGTWAKADGHLALDGVIPRAPGNLSQRTGVTGGMVLLLALLFALGPRAWRRVDRAMRPTLAPRGLVEEALELWREPNRGRRAPTGSLAEPKSVPQAQASPDAPPPNAVRPPRRNVLRAITKLETTEPDAHGDPS